METGEDVNLHYTVGLNALVAARKLELDDSTVQEIFGYENVGAFRDDVASMRGARYDDASRGLLTHQIMSHLAEAGTFELPESMLTQRYAELCRMERLRRNRDDESRVDAGIEQEDKEDDNDSGLTDDDSTEAGIPVMPDTDDDASAPDGEIGDDTPEKPDEPDAGLDEETRARLQAEAARVTRSSVHLLDISARNDLALSEAEHNRIQTSVWQELSGQTDDRQYISMVTRNAIQQTQTKKVLDFITELADVSVVSVSEEEMKQKQAEATGGGWLVPDRAT